MNGDEDVFCDALALPASERASFLSTACREDAAQRARVEALLYGHDRAQEILNVPITPRFSIPPENNPGDLIGRYKLLQKIGEGGMGVVYHAEQSEPMRRRVALKIIKLGMDTRTVIARFEAERQALALMDHPNIARVMDGGATDFGRPYFVMELVRGVKITEYCDDAGLSTRERIELFIQVCHAIQHAHQKGIIHRDIKPSNILVTVNDGLAVPKVIDFGIAKATEGRLSDETLVTQFDAVIGTPAYMSPEQTMITSVDVDTRSDIYSLGVLLYEMLAGRTPFDAKELIASGIDQMRSTIREAEPVRPSTRIATLHDTELSATAKRRSVDSAKLQKELQGDLDWIVMKCLEKDRARRYETAAALAADLNRHLNNEAVFARPPSAAYRIQKLMLRNRLVFAAAAAVGVALVAGVSFSTWAFLGERRARAGETAQRVAATAAQSKAEAARVSEQEQRLRADAENRTAQRNLYAAQMKLAQQAWDQNNLSRLRQLLAETGTYPERGFEWYYWQQQTHLPVLTLRGYLSHDANVWSVAFSPDGRRIVTGNGDHNGRVWDAVSGEQLFRLEHGTQFHSVAFSPNGLWIVAGLNGAIKLWDAATGAERLTLKAHDGRPVRSVSFSPDSQQILSGGEDNIARTWTTTGSALLAFRGHRAEITSVAFSPDGKRIISGSGDQSAKVWSAATATEEFSLVGHAGPVRSAAFSPDGQRIVTASNDRTARIWDAVGGRELLTLNGHGNLVSSAVFSPDGQSVATASWDRTIIIWNAIDGAKLRTLKGHENLIHALAFSHNGQRLVSGSKDQTARVWDVHQGSSPTSLKGHRRQITSVAFSPDSARIVTAGTDHTAKVWGAHDARELLTLMGHTAPISAVTFSPDGQRILTASEDRTARLWSASVGRELISLKDHPGPLWYAAFSPDGRRIVTGGAYRTAKVWDAESGQALLTLSEDAGAILSAAFSPDGQRIVTGSSNRSLTIWDAATGRVGLKLNSHAASILSVAFSRDGWRVVSGGADGSAKVWDSSGGGELLTLAGHTAPITSLSFSPDDRRIVTGSDDGSVRMWDVAGGQELLSLVNQSTQIKSVAFSPNGQLLVAGNGDGTASVWRTAGTVEVAAWQKEEAAVAQRLAELARVRPGLPSFADAATTAEKYLAALNSTGSTERDPVGMTRAADPGAIKRWLVLAPIPWPVSKGFAFDSDQIEGESRIRPRAGESTAWESGTLTWQEISQHDFVIDFIHVLGRTTERSVAYAVCYVHSETAQSNLQLLVGSDSRAKIYLNEKMVYENRSGRPFDPDHDTKHGIELNAGLNVLVLKVVVEAELRRWRDSVRFTDASGNPVKGITVTLDP